MPDALESTRLAQVYNRVARHYDAYHALVTLRSDARGRKIVVKHGVHPGDAVLDAGGGTGATSLLAAERVGPAGHVTVLDMTDGMLDIARAKAREAGLDGRMTFQTGDILALPFADASFDAVLSTYSLCPLYDASQGALELYRVLKPGGRLGAAFSVEPSNTAVRWVAHRAEKVLWRFPSLTLGCRAVSVLPALEKAGAQVLLDTRIGVPLWPFQVLVVQKPA
ncbi:MAG: class I SAM-dependent methyltransferase [Deltaproteobacteria bacterium]|nr:class I SAM-dependent methyltransferase [Deltaproteobacteria bacterium]